MQVNQLNNSLIIIDGHMKLAADAWWNEVHIMNTTNQFNKEARKVGMIGHFTQVIFFSRKYK